MREQVTGTVILHCEITLHQRAKHCRVVRETPTGYEFGASALDMSHVFLIKPVVIDGMLFDRAPVLIPVIFEIRSGAPPR